jgi:hypothetical protein
VSAMCYGCCNKFDTDMTLDVLDVVVVVSLV